jgi:starch phosphorylase
MKPPLHGGINCSILDGWWPEAYNGRNGWAITEHAGRSRATQDRREADAIYTLIETRIAPLFYSRGRDGVPTGWIKCAAESMRTVCGVFNTHRMLAEYLRLYAPTR